MHDNRRKGVKEEGGELVKAVEHEAVLPDDDGTHERTHAENIVGLVSTISIFDMKTCFSP